MNPFFFLFFFKQTTALLDHSALTFKLLTPVGENMNSESFSSPGNSTVLLRDDIQKNLDTLPQETIPISAITSVNHVYVHKRSSQPELSLS